MPWFAKRIGIGSVESVVEAWTVPIIRVHPCYYSERKTI